VLRNNMLSIYIAPAVYDPDGAVSREVARFVEWVKASPPAVTGQPVLLPGEVERTTRAQRSAKGIAIDDQTWKDLMAAAASVGMSAESATAMIADRAA
jgi:uncharacterized oxidoreductase